MNIKGLRVVEYAIMVLFIVFCLFIFSKCMLLHTELIFVNDTPFTVEAKLNQHDFVINPGAKHSVLVDHNTWCVFGAYALDGISLHQWGMEFIAEALRMTYTLEIYEQVQMLKEHSYYLLEM